MEQVALFEKVSFEEFSKAYLNIFGSEYEMVVKKIYDDIILPKRATTGSAGYDFFAPMALKISKGETILIPTGIRAKILEGYCLILIPRSSLGFKYRLQLDNTLGLIDSDYYYSDNEGHIFVKLTCDSIKNNEVIIKKGQGFVQGVFLPFGITVDDDAEESRNGGFGSTDK